MITNIERPSNGCCKPSRLYNNEQCKKETNHSLVNAIDDFCLYQAASYTFVAVTIVTVS